MINNKEQPVGWAMLMYELEDAQEHLSDLVGRLSHKGSIDETDFKIQLGHIYSHLNRAWNGRNNEEAVFDEQWRTQSRFPSDLEPV
jgi:hypothetical protein